MWYYNINQANERQPYENTEEMYDDYQRKEPDESFSLVNGYLDHMIKTDSYNPYPYYPGI
jgi:hypothetical protein